MIPELLWIVGIYAMAAALANGVIGKNAGAVKRHYVLIAGNHQSQIEWYIRALKRFSRRTGTDIGITVLLEHSADESGSIVEYLRETATKSVSCAANRAIWMATARGFANKGSGRSRQADSSCGWSWENARICRSSHCEPVL